MIHAGRVAESESDLAGVKRETKIEIENYALTADNHDGLLCTVLLWLS